MGFSQSLQLLLEISWYVLILALVLGRSEIHGPQLEEKKCLFLKLNVASHTLIPPTLSFPLPLTAWITDEDRQQLCYQLAQLKEQAQKRSGRKTGVLDLALLISTSTTSERLLDSLVFCIVTGWFFFTPTI